MPEEKLIVDEESGDDGFLDFDAEEESDLEAERES